MQSVSYDDVTHPVRADFAEAHTRYWQRLQSAGAWFSAAQRIAIARTAREAVSCAYCQKRKKALSPYTLKGEHSHSEDLPATVIDAVHGIVTDAQRLTKSWYQQLLDDGLTEGEYIELVGTVVSIVSIDSFANALGIAQAPLPAPGKLAKDTAISRYRPATAVSSDQAWVPMVAENNAGTPEADLWPANRTGNVVRALSLVPDEVRTLKDLSAVHYLEMKKVRQPGIDAGRSLNRSQMELVAGRVSALNECYY